MDVHMTGEAARELIVECRFVRLAMAVGALRHIAVFILMAGYACQLAMLALVTRQFAENLGVAGSAGA